MARGRRGGGGVKSAAMQASASSRSNASAEADVQRRPPSSSPPPRPAATVKDPNSSDQADSDWIKSIRESAERAAENEFTKKASEMWKLAETMMQQMDKQHKELEQEVKRCHQNQLRMEEEKAQLELGFKALKERLSAAENALATTSARANVMAGFATPGWAQNSWSAAPSWGSPGFHGTGQAVPGPSPSLLRLSEARTPPSPVRTQSFNQTTATYAPVPNFPFCSSVPAPHSTSDNQSRTVEPAMPPKCLLESAAPPGLAGNDKGTPKSTPKFRPRVSSNLGVLPELSEMPPPMLLPPPGLEDQVPEPKSPKATQKAENWCFTSPKRTPSEAPQVLPSTPSHAWPASSMRSPPGTPSTPQRAARISLLGCLTPMKMPMMSPMRQSSLLKSPMKSPMLKSPAVPPSPFTICEGGGVIFGFQLRRADGVPLGIDYELVSSPDEVDSIVVTGIQSGSAIEAWNKQCTGGPGAGKAVMPGDKITSVNCRTEVLDMIPELESRTLLKIMITRDEPDLKAMGGEDGHDAPRSLTTISELDMSRPLTMRADACPFVPIV